MRYLHCAGVVFVSLLASASIAAAQTATQTVTFQVQAINEISVSGDPGQLTINSASAGGQLQPATDNSTTYSITTNEAGKKIAISLDADMPTDVTLEVSLAAPATAVSEGDVALSTVAADAVTAISNLAESGLTITYTLSATSAAAVMPTAETRVVTLTIM